MILYTTPTCKYCPEIKKTLTIAGIEFEERNAIEHREHLKANGVAAVPALEVNGDFYLGDMIKTYIHGLE